MSDLSGFCRCCSDESFLRHNVVEVVRSDRRVAIRVSSVHHLLQLLICHRFTEFAGNTPQIANGDCTGAIVIEESEDFVDVLASVSIAHPSGHHVEELLKVNVIVLVFVEVCDHLIDSLVLGLEAERLHSGSQLARVNRPTTIRVEQVKGFFDFLDFIFCETGTEVLVSLEFSSTGRHLC